jgi:hypothetical protein
MDQPANDLLVRTEQVRRENGERRLARDFFMQMTWVLLAAATLAQLVLLVWLDVLS